MSKIAYIIRPITNGMYNDTYTVYYTNGTRRRYTINGAMNKKHFEFIQSATVEAFYSKWTGAHKHDIFRPAPAEEPTAEEPTAEEPAAEEPAAEEPAADQAEEEAAEEPAADQAEEEAAEEPAEVQAEEPAEEKPAENPNDSAFIAEMFAALDYFKRVLWSYIDGTRYERDISGDFWGAHECSVILSFVNVLLKSQGKEPYYKLKNDFDSLSECFEEIMQKFEYGDERTIEEIISEYNFS